MGSQSKSEYKEHQMASAAAPFVRSPAVGDRKSNVVVGDANVAFTTERFSPITGQSSLTLPPSKLLQQSESNVTADDQAFAAAERCKEQGNTFYNQKSYSQALKVYEKGIEYLLARSKVTGSRSSPSSDTVATELLINMHSNRVMTLIKLQDFSEAQRVCTFLIEQMNQVNQYKILYRRAMAYEGQAAQILAAARDSSIDDDARTRFSEQGLSLLKFAKKDLKRALQIIESPQSFNITHAASKDAKHSISNIAKRVQQTMLALENFVAKKTTGSQKSLEGKVSAIPPSSSQQLNVESQSQLRERSPHFSFGVSVLSPQKQSQDVLNLLMNRLEVLKRKAAAAPSTAAAAASGQGEAFFLLDWNWWCHWCDYTRLLDTSVENGASTKSRSTALNVLSLLPKGAVLPKMEKSCHEITNKNINLVEGRTDSEDSDDNIKIHHENLKGPPGPIDNSQLLLETIEPSKRTFYEQWYFNSICYAISENGGGGHTNNALSTALRPNLVRGYHYEIIPREVYAALRAWYGEVTPELCYRSKLLPAYNQLVVQLYQKQQQKHQQQLKSQVRCSACQALNAGFRCTRCFSARYCNQTCQESHWPYHKMECRNISLDGAKGQYATFVPQMCDGRVGLNNLGNTCFMNAALQSLSHATPLTRHFLSNKFVEDLNSSNPLGTGGNLAKAYESVMKELWMQNDASTSPTKLKRAIALFAPRFAGCLQHDAQEFLAYLLDGLHEDLNRIRKAPYIEMPDVTERQNMAVAGARAWDAHRRRNDSLVMDTFYGQFKSTCVCPICSRVSVSFDTFNHVSLEIPQPKNVLRPTSILVFRRPDKAEIPGRPVRYGVEVELQTSIAELRQMLSNLIGVDDQTSILFICEMYASSIIDTLKDNKLLSSIQPYVHLVAYEVDSIATTCFHAVATHIFAGTSTEHINISGKPEAFGIPFITSFSSTFTCRQVWDHIWTLVSPMVGPAGREVLQIRLHDGMNIPVLAFPCSQQSSKIVETKENIDDDDIYDADIYEDDGAACMMTATLPQNLDKPFHSFLGENAMEKFIFFWLEWDDSVPLRDNYQAGTESVIDEDRFNDYDNHSSYIHTTERYLAKNGSNGVTLGQCFKNFTRPERLDEQNMWYCSSCKQHVCAMKTMELWRLPDILIIHLKRFEFKHALRRDKLDTFVDFPMDSLDMSDYCPQFDPTSFVDETIPAIYDLFSVINHNGRMGFGHYTAFARKWDETSISSDWVLFDDSSARLLSNGANVANVATPAAYVLFYRRRVFS